MDNVEIQEAREFFYNMIEDLDKHFPEVFSTSIFCNAECRNWLYEYYQISVECGCDKIGFIPVDSELGYVLKVNINSYDSCYDELKIYELAKQEGVDFCLAAAYEGFVYNGRHFILMEYARPDEDGIYMMSEPQEGYGEDDEDLREDCEVAWDAFINFWGADDMSEAESFIDKWDISDLHTANCGWTFDGELKFFDYSGYLVERPEFHGEVE